MRCGKCGNFYIGEKQKDNVYYRCHTRNCTKGAVKESSIGAEVSRFLKPLELNEFEYRFLKQEMIKQSGNSEAEFELNYRRLQLLREQIKDRLSKLADAYVDNVFDKETYINKKNELLMEEQSVKEEITNLRKNSEQSATRFEEFLELLNSAYLSFN